MRGWRRAPLYSIVFVVLGVLTPAFPAWAAPELVFVSPPQRVGVGMPAGPIQIQRQDSGSPLEAGEPQRTVTLTSSSGTGEFSLNGDPAGTWSNTLDVTIPADGSRASDIWYRDPTAGAPTITASAPGYSPVTQAQEVTPLGFADDVESGTLLASDTPPGRWTYATRISPPNSVLASTAAAHRGQYGIRHIDAESIAGAGEQNGVNLQSAEFAGEWYGRVWIRLTSSNDLGSIIVLHAGTPGPSTIAFIDVTIRFPGARLHVGGFDDSGAYFTDSTTSSLQPGTWHLLEVAVTDIGTLDGTRTVWLNGQLVRTRSGIDWTDPAMRLGLSALGQPYSGDRRFTGVVDFDDFRSSVVPHASRISLDVAPGAIQPGDCVPVAVALRDSVTGAVAPAPYDVDVDMGFSGGSGVTGGFFSDPGCSTPTLQLRVASGATSGIVYFQPDASGSASIIGTQVDFLPATASISVQAPVPVPVPSPKIVSPGEASVACGQPWSAATEVEGEGPFTFELQPVSGGAVPEGLRLDAGTGVLSWTPTRLQAGAHRVERVVRSGSMSDVQLMELEVRCDAPPALGVGCSCAQGGSASTALTWLAGLLVLALPRARSAGLRPRS